jgi:uncharacterized protein (DUF1499 family)
MRFKNLLKGTLGVLAVLLLAGTGMFAYLGYVSHRGHAPGLQPDGRLAPCPPTPNCVTSESATDATHAIRPLGGGPGGQAAIWQALRAAVLADGGHIVSEDEKYLAATFTSRIFRFVDDFEARCNADGPAIEVRSASRVGRGDMGVNRARVERLRADLAH